MNRTEYYRTTDGKEDYEFSYEKQDDGNYRIYIKEQPSYKNRPTSAVPTHRHHDGERYYVCWTHPIESIKAAENIASKWADSTQDYIKEGTRF